MLPPHVNSITDLLLGIFTNVSHFFVNVLGQSKKGWDVKNTVHITTFDFLSNNDFGFGDF